MPFSSGYIICPRQVVSRRGGRGGSLLQNTPPPFKAAGRARSSMAAPLLIKATAARQAGGQGRCQAEAVSGDTLVGVKCCSAVFIRRRDAESEHVTPFLPSTISIDTTLRPSK